MQMMQVYARSSATSASAMPVFPAVPSTIVPPGLSTPRVSASSTIPRAARSLTDPPGFRNSALPKMRRPNSRDSARSSIRGVAPTASEKLMLSGFDAFAAKRRGAAGLLTLIESQSRTPRAHDSGDTAAGVFIRDRLDEKRRIADLRARRRHE